MRCRRTIAALVAIILGLVCSGHSLALADLSMAGERGDFGVWRVGPATDPDCEFQDIQDAIDDMIDDDGGFSTAFITISGPPSLHQGNTYFISSANIDSVRTLHVWGGFDSCSDSSPSGGRSVLDADRNDRVFELRYDAEDSDPVIEIWLRNLEITGGLANDGDGGAGIRIRGHSGRQRIRLDNLVIDDNRTLDTFGLLSAHGGGISLRATAGSSSTAPWITVHSPFQGLEITNNRAQARGGGIACDNFTGDDNPPIELENATIRGNRARTDGGGLSIAGCTNVHLRASAADLFGPGVHLNIAGDGEDGFGGGIHVANGGELRVNPRGTTHAALISANSADAGGGIWASDLDTVVLLFNTNIRGNTTGGTGGGIHLQNFAFLEMGRDGVGAAGPAGTCLEDIQNPLCSRIENNAADGNGGAIRIDFATARINQTWLTGNTSAGLGSAGSLSDHASLTLEGAAISGNSGSSRLFQIVDSVLNLRWSTIAGNRDPDDPPLQVFRHLDAEPSVNNLAVENSIVWEPGATMINADGDDATAQAHCMIGHTSEDNSGFDELEFYSHIDPRLVAPQSNDLRLRIDSPAVDYCDDEVSPPLHNDLHNNPRGVDVGGPLTEAPDGKGGAFDLGVHERQSVEELIFHDRFENQ